MRERNKDGTPSTWTGLGFMRVVEGSKLEFDIENIETSMEYDLVLKYEPQVRMEMDCCLISFEKMKFLQALKRIWYVTDFHHSNVIGIKSAV